MRDQIRWCLLGAVVALLSGCGKGGDAADVAGGGDEASGPAPCALLSPAEVATVLPNADEGYEAARGGSLVKGVDSYQCSYSEKGTSGNMLLVMFHTAATDALFDDIKPKDPTWAAGEENVRPVRLGDGGWLKRGERKLSLEASRGHLVIQLSLDAPNALDEEADLVALGQALLDALQNVQT